jgi:hypothetical protein
MFYALAHSRPLDTLRYSVVNSRPRFIYPELVAAD